MDEADSRAPAEGSERFETLRGPGSGRAAARACGFPGAHTARAGAASPSLFARDRDSRGARFAEPREGCGKSPADLPFPRLGKTSAGRATRSLSLAAGGVPRLAFRAGTRHRATRLGTAPQGAWRLVTSIFPERP